MSTTLYEYKDLWWHGIKVNEEYLNVAEDEKDFIEPIEVNDTYYNIINNQLKGYANDAQGE